MIMMFLQVIHRCSI